MRLIEKKNRIVTAKATMQKELSAPCLHGIAQAHLNPFLCDKCTIDFYFYLKENATASTLVKYQFHFSRYKDIIDEQEKREAEVRAEAQRRKEWWDGQVLRYGLSLANHIHEENLSSVEIGKRYERYVGYMLEIDGWCVDFDGIRDGIANQGVDITAKKGNEIKLIQCKRWSTKREIQYNAAMLLVGHKVDEQRKNPNKKISLSIWTQNDNLGAAAKEICDNNNIEHIVSKYPFDKGEEYPLIKCNIGANGAKIYHIPGNANYDTIKIETHKGEFYAYTPAEAVASNFRPARN